MENKDVFQSIANKHIAILEEKATDNWRELQSICSSLDKYSSYKSFKRLFKLYGECRARDELFNDFKEVEVFGKSINCLMILLFNKELQKFAYSARYPSIREDAWSIIVTEFLGMLPALQHNCHVIKEYLREVRARTTSAMRKAVAKRERKTIEAFCGWQEAIYKRGSISKQAEEASYSELLEYLKARLQPEEFDALMQRCRQQYYLRKTPIPGLKEARNTAVERRAVRKARILLSKYPAD